MIRGYLLEMRKSIKELFSVDENDFQEYIGEDLEFENIKIVDEDLVFEDIGESQYGAVEYENMYDKPAKYVDFLLKTYRNAGMTTGYEEANGCLIPYLIIDHDFKEKYFRESYDKFMLKLQEISFEDFICGSIDWNLLFELRYLWGKEEYGDAVTSDEMKFISLTDFIRHAEGKYYVGAVFIMY